MIPFLDLKEINQQMNSELLEASQRVIESGWYIGGKELQHFEEKFAGYCGTQECIGVANGLDALVLTLRAWKEMGFLNDGWIKLDDLRRKENRCMGAIPTSASRSPARSGRRARALGRVRVRARLRLDRPAR